MLHGTNYFLSEDEKDSIKRIFLLTIYSFTSPSLFRIWSLEEEGVRVFVGMFLSTTTALLLTTSSRIIISFIMIMIQVFYLLIKISRLSNHSYASYFACIKSTVAYLFTLTIYSKNNSNVPTIKFEYSILNFNKTQLIFPSNWAHHARKVFFTFSWEAAGPNFTVIIVGRIL